MRTMLPLALVFVPLALAACSSNDAPVAAAPSDAGGTTFTPDAYVPPNMENGTDLTVQGKGTVFGAIHGDAGPLVDCVGDGTSTTGACHAEYHETLYASPADGYVFTEWTPLGRTIPTLFVAEGTPTKVTAVFSPEGATPPSIDAGAPGDSGPSDAGQE